jgi:CHAT domain-containing protein
LFPPPGAYADSALVTSARLSIASLQQGMTLDAEVEARRALLDALHRHGRYSFQAAPLIAALAAVIDAEGRPADAETLSRIALDTFATVGVDDTSASVVSTRVTLISALVAQRHWQEANQEFKRLQNSLKDDPKGLRASAQRIELAIAALHGDAPVDAVTLARQSVEDSEKIFGSGARQTAEAQGILGVTLQTAGDTAAAQSAFAKAMPILLAMPSRSQSTGPSDSSAAGTVFATIIEGYLALLNADPTAANIAEAFRAADLLRGRAVSQAAAEAAAREDVPDPQLAALVRRQQDSDRLTAALTALLANGYTQPDGQRDDVALQKIQAQIAQLDQTRQQSRAEIERRFPNYAQLTNPQPATIEETRAALGDGEALLATYIGEDRSYVWAVPKSGPVAFATVKLSRQDVETAVASLRRALDPQPTILGDIPEFDVALAYRLYAAFLAPVKAGWAGAQNLLVVPHRALGQLPFGLLVTAPTTLQPLRPSEPLFANYKAMPWLIRNIAITQLPSVTSLTTLRHLNRPASDRRAFTGFGDPWFTLGQEQVATQRRPAQAPPMTQVASRGLKLDVRAPSKTEDMASAEVDDLPPLPDTAEEVRQVAASLHADPKTDVFLGAAANEQTVRTTRLDDRRVVMFATHGLIASDLDGLTEPALALTAPAIAHVPGDGLLTMSKILGLRLDADWIVLSACNTGAGNGAGADAVSGLGLAFFYAGARAVLASNWPVETLSARLLTTGLFERETATPGISRAEALRQSELVLINGPGFVDPESDRAIYSYAHPIFWAPFSVIGDGGKAQQGHPTSS